MPVPYIDNEELQNYIDYFEGNRYRVTQAAFDAEYNGDTDKKESVLIDSFILDDAINACKLYDVFADDNAISEITLMRIIEQAQFIIAAYPFKNGYTTTISTVPTVSSATWIEESFTGLTSGNTLTLSHIPIWTMPYMANRNGLGQQKDDDFTITSYTITVSPDFSASEGSDGVGETFYITYYYFNS